MTEKKTPNEILEDARRMIGNEVGPFPSPYPVEHEPIRRYCMMVDDENPLYLDPEYARGTRYGAVILPPFAPFGIMSGGSPQMMAKLMEEGAEGKGVMPPAPGMFLINMAQEWEWFRPVKAGDRLATKIRLADVYLKPIRIDPKAFWIVLEFIFLNQDGETVCVARNVVLRHRSPDEAAQDG